MDCCQDDWHRRCRWTDNRTNRTKRDGKEYPYDGPKGKGTISFKWIDERTTESVMKYPGGHTLVTRTVIAKDGKTRTSTARGTGPNGEKVNDITVWDRE
jgi:hypothetical protein